MCIRHATHNDFPVIRTLPVQLTPRAVTALKPKHFRVLFQENNVRLLVNEDNATVNGFMALRFMPTMDSGIRFLVVTHFGVHRQARKYGIAAELEAHATDMASDHQCVALLAHAGKMPPAGLSFFRNLGYQLDNETLIKRLK